MNALQIPVQQALSSNAGRPGIVIAISGHGKMNVDDVNVVGIVMDVSAQRLVDRRAREEGISRNDAFEKSLIEAVREYMDAHEPRNWWAA